MTANEGGKTETVHTAHGEPVGGRRMEPVRDDSLRTDDQVLRESGHETEERSGADDVKRSMAFLPMRDLNHDPSAQRLNHRERSKGETEHSSPRTRRIRIRIRSSISLRDSALLRHRPAGQEYRSDQRDRDPRRLHRGQGDQRNAYLVQLARREATFRRRATAEKA